jgi:thiazole synthase
MSDKGTLTVRGLRMQRLWHCFGTERHRVPLEMIVELLSASRTNVLAINTHRLGRSRLHDALEHGFAGVSMDLLANHVDMTRYIKVLNINMRITAVEAVRAAQLAVDMTGERILKLEVLDSTLRQSNDNEVLDAARRLLRWDPSLLVLPLITNDFETARRAIDVGCPLLRVMGASIGSQHGIVDPACFEKICGLTVPVILDGGIGHPDHLRWAVQLGAQAALINSVLFDSGRPPLEVMRDFRVAADRAFARATE